MQGCQGLTQCIILLHNNLIKKLDNTHVVMVVTSFEVIHDLTGLSNSTEVSSSHSLRMLSVSGLPGTQAISNTNTTCVINVATLYVHCR